MQQFLLPFQLVSLEKTGGKYAYYGKLIKRHFDTIIQIIQEWSSELTLMTIADPTCVTGETCLS